MIIPTSELTAASDTDPTGGPLQLFGYSQVDEAFLLISNMLPQERRQLAERLAAHDAPGADEFAQQLIDAVYDTKGDRYQRLQRMVEGIIWW